MNYATIRSSAADQAAAQLFAARVELLELSGTGKTERPTKAGIYSAFAVVDRAAAEITRLRGLLAFVPALDIDTKVATMHVTRRINEIKAACAEAQMEVPA